MKSFAIGKFLLIPIVIFALLIFSPAVLAEESLIAYHVGCSSLTITFRTTDETAYELHSHVYISGTETDLTGYEDSPYHYVPLDGAGTYTITLIYQFPQPQGTVLFIDTLHTHSKEETSDFLYGDYTCSDEPVSGEPGRPNDDRANWTFGDLESVMYLRTDENGQPAVHLYCVEDGSVGVIGLVVTEEDLKGFSQFPSENTLVKSSDVCKVSFYILTTGEYQVTIGPDALGKIYAIVGTGLEFANRHMHILDPYAA